MQQSTIKLSKDTKNRLRKLGDIGDTFEDVVNGLLDQSEEPVEKRD